VRALLQFRPMKITKRCRATILGAMGWRAVCALGQTMPWLGAFAGSNHSERSAMGGGVIRQRQLTWIIYISSMGTQ
jgi:hypothetical protein